MKKGSLLKKGLVVLSLLSVVACTSTQPQGNGNLLTGPEWTRNQNSMPDYVTAVGSVQVGQAGIAISTDIALAKARAKLGQQMKVKVASIIKDYTKVTGSANNQEARVEYENASRQLSIETLENSKQLNAYMGKDKTLSVLVGISKESIREKAEAKLKAVEAKLEAEKVITTHINAKDNQEFLDGAMNKLDEKQEETTEAK